MRNCVNEQIDVYEAEGNNLADLLREVAETVEARGEENFTIVDLTIDRGFDGNTYLLTLFIN